ncbi:hypothetical protein ES703_15817 [subsurface metagenome]
MKVITLQRPAVCADCGADLPVGTRARYYSADRIYCESHDEKPARSAREMADRHFAEQMEHDEPATREPGTREPKTRPLFSDDSPDIEAWIQFLEEVQAALTSLIDRLRRS